MPLTDSDSCTAEESLASWRCRSPVIFFRSRPTRRLIHTNTGSSSSETIVSRQSSATIATTLATTAVRFDTSEVAVPVTVDCIPPMSLAIRDCTSPVRVRVKNASDIRCRCRYTDVRRSCMTRCPTVVEISVCSTLSTLVTTAAAIIPSASSVSSPVRRSGIAVSSTARNRNGVTTDTTADAATSSPTTASRPAYGRNSPRIRRT